MLVSRNHAAPYLTNYLLNIIIYEDQHFQFEFEDIQVDDSSITWDYASAKIVSTERVAVGDVAAKNNSNNEQSYTLNLAEGVSVTGIAEQVGGFPLSGGVKFTSASSVHLHGFVTDTF